MKIHVFDLFANETFVYEGEPRQVEIYLRRAYPWLNEKINPGHLGACIDELNDAQHLDCELEDPRAELPEYESGIVLKSEIEVDTALDAFDLNDLLENGVAAQPTTMLKLVDAARWMAKTEKSPEIGTLTKNLENCSSLEEAALKTYDIVVTPDSIRTLQSVSKSILYKTENEAVDPPNTIYSVYPDGQATVDALKRAFQAEQVYVVNLGGKHSKGSMVAEDPQTRQRYMLKPGDGRNSKAAGVNDSPISQSKREAIFYKASEFFGLDAYLPATDLVLVDSHEIAVYELLPKSFDNLGTAFDDKAYQISLTLQPFLQNGVLHKWAVMDYVLGNPDRHSQNIMVNKSTKQIYLIDHGSALAGKHFDPAHDSSSFIPYYLRAWSSRQFSAMTPGQRVHFMPRAGTSGLLELTEWITNLDTSALKNLLSSLGVADPQPYVNRLESIKTSIEPKDETVNKLWAGVTPVTTDT